MKGGIEFVKVGIEFVKVGIEFVKGGIEFVSVDFKTYVTSVYDDDICV